MKFNSLPLLVAFVVTFILTPVVRRIALSLRILDYPNIRKTHNSSMPLLGSISVYLGFLAGLFLSGFHPFFGKELFILFSATTLLLVVGGSG